MSALQEVLAVLLGAESEAKRIVDEAKSEYTNLLRVTQEKFTGERENRMSAAREQAKGIMGNALSAAQTEAKQILDLGKEERDRVARRFNENLDAVVGSVVAETVDRILAGGE